MLETEKKNLPFPFVRGGRNILESLRPLLFLSTDARSFFKQIYSHSHQRLMTCKFTVTFFITHNLTSVCIMLVILNVIRDIIIALQSFNFFWLPSEHKMLIFLATKFPFSSVGHHETSRHVIWDIIIALQSFNLFYCPQNIKCWFSCNKVSM